MLFVEFVTLVLVLWKPTTLVPTNLQSKLKKTCYAWYIAFLKIRLPLAPSLMKVYIQKIWSTGDDSKWRSSLRALKSLCTQEIHRFKEQKSFSASHLLLCLWEILFQLKPKKILHLLSPVSFLPSFFSLKEGIIRRKSFQLCGFILNWDFHRKRRDLEQLLNKVNSLNYIVCCFNQIQWWWRWWIRLPQHNGMEQECAVESTIIGWNFKCPCLIFSLSSYVICL